jgi:hypothetical protein
MAVNQEVKYNVNIDAKFKFKNIQNIDTMGNVIPTVDSIIGSIVDLFMQYL